MFGTKQTRFKNRMESYNSVIRQDGRYPNSRDSVRPFLDLQTYRLLQTCRMLLVFARTGGVCPYVFIVLVISTAWEISRYSLERFLVDALYLTCC